MVGWSKQRGIMRKTKHRRIARVVADFLLDLDWRSHRWMRLSLSYGCSTAHWFDDIFPQRSQLRKRANLIRGARCSLGQARKAQALPAHA